MLKKELEKIVGGLSKPSYLHINASLARSWPRFQALFVLVVMH
jgi:hypothetical protein